ncbi:MAG: spore coat associated protein CotJA [Bacillota bacterium]|nr:spore coat associated protein CotJA [Bacillota bacterium]
MKGVTGVNDNMKPELATAYVPYQEYTQIYPPMEAFKKGTVFPELYKPYESGKVWAE